MPKNTHLMDISSVFPWYKNCRFKGSFTLCFLFLLLISGCGTEKQERIYFANLVDGARLESPFWFKMRTENISVEPTAHIEDPKHGYPILLIDRGLPTMRYPINKNENQRHFKDGETEAVLDLPEGEHTLLLLFAKWDGVPYYPPIYQKIRIDVIKRNAFPVRNPLDSVEADTGNME